MPESRIRYFDALSTLVWCCWSILSSRSWDESSSAETCSANDRGGSLTPGFWPSGVTASVEGDSPESGGGVASEVANGPRVICSCRRNSALSARDSAASARISSTMLRSSRTCVCRSCTAEASESGCAVGGAGSCAHPQTLIAIRNNAVALDPRIQPDKRLPSLTIRLRRRLWK